MAILESEASGDILGAGIWETVVKRDTETGAVVAKVIINGTTVVADGTSIVAASNSIRALINSPDTSSGLKQLYARALQSLSRQNAELVNNQNADQRVNQIGEPLPGVNSVSNAIANGTGGTTASITASNQSEEDEVQLGAQSTSGLASGTTYSANNGVNSSRPAGGSQSISAIGAETAAARDAGFETSRVGEQSNSGLNPSKSNPLSQLSSYTYSLVLYMVTPEKMNEFHLNGGSLNGIKETGSGVYIIAQSGGVNNSAESRLVTLSNKLGLGQEGYDYYIDDLALSTLLVGGPNRQTVSTEINFKIYEPYSFSLLTDVAKASRSVNASSEILKNKPEDLTGFQQHYIVGIKFYGYDANGNIVTSDRTKFGDTGDRNAFIQRFFAIKFKNIKFKLDGKMTVYNCETVVVSEQEAYNQTNGGVRAQLTLSGSTVGEVLAGSGSSLAKSLTEMNNAAKATNQIELPTEIKIQFLDETGKPVSISESEIGKSSLLDDGAFAAATAPLSQAKSTSQVTVANSFKATTISVDKKTVGVISGQPIITVIDNIIVKSRWITDALTKTVTDDPEGKTKEITSRRELRWYTINPVVIVKGFDTKTNNWAYDITYNIKPYDIPYVKTSLANKTKYPGPYKLYNYLFTGENTEILSYEQQFDNLYFIIASESTNSSERPATTGRTPVAITNTPGNSDPNSGKQNKGSKLNDEVKAQLYSPGDRAQAKIKILGDPDYIMTTTGVDMTSADRFYGNDGSISPLGGQVFIQIVFKMAIDYNTKDDKLIDNGLMDVTDKIQFYQTDRISKAGIKGTVYMITQVDSTFSRGQFTQVLDCLMVDETVLLTPEKEAENDGNRENNTGADSTPQTTTATTAPTAQSNSTAKDPSPPESSPAIPQNVRTADTPRSSPNTEQPAYRYISGRAAAQRARNNSNPQFTTTQGVNGVIQDDSNLPPI